MVTIVAVFKDKMFSHVALTRLIGLAHVNFPVAIYANESDAQREIDAFISINRSIPMDFDLLIIPVEFVGFDVV